ncbi:MAG: DUF1273 domain-containing protein [Ruminococcus sp.]|nr:DUF1273 domain-containing protein [Ruminococcus sp.]
MEIIRDKTCSFSGHRPEKLIIKNDCLDFCRKVVKSVLRLAVQDAVNQGYNTFITGMSRGTDLWAAEAVLDLRVSEKFRDDEIKLVAAIPFPEFGKDFRGESLASFKYILRHSDEIIYTSPAYHKDAYKVRNYYMVDNSSKLIAVLKDTVHHISGTNQTVNYAKRQGLDVQIIDVNKIEENFNANH